MEDLGGRDEKGGDKLVINGYHTLVEYLSLGLAIETGCVVTRVVHKIDENKVEVVTTRGTWLADYVVLTVPLGVLKANSITFCPALSREKIEAIHGLGFGALNKIALRFSQIFWSPKCSWMSAILSDCKKELGLVEMHNLYKKSAEPLLMIYVNPSVTYNREVKNWTDNEMIEMALNVLCRYFGDVPRKLFLEGIVTAWHRDPFARGSYSYVPLHCSASLHDQLSLPEMNGRLLFAGEATFREHPGTVDGAYSSGQREAKRIINTVFPSK
eukprot:TRINITY_DN3939_c0_g1_i12.p1 TRINITY_DN3939_c0_g1~~TRINITY_DN3939_c0_g1_i12.p1  ORF type:complete len:270 (-),score=63.91 TRINITY_DN3939_c0_g1_i12:1550-2359(-)